MKTHLTLALGLLLICSGMAVAQTPDWMTPSEETICDTETGAAFGLCNAFCEAMDCDSANAQASPTACSKVKAKFANITGRDFLPCEVCPPPPPGTTCPCTDALTDFGLALTYPGVCQDIGRVGYKFTEVALIAATCGLPETGFSGACATQGPNGYQLLTVTPDEGSACIQAILDSCNPE